jgi:aminomethyltransferase
MTELKQTPLNAIHKKLGAKMVPFGGWEMPVQYTSIIAEHIATRTQAGLFDVSHMGEIFLEGEENKLLPFLEKMTCNKVEGLKDGQVQYNAVMNENSGLVDDITLYKFTPEKYLICSNASNFESVYTHLQKYNTGLDIRNDSKAWHQIAIQGPKAASIWEEYIGKSFQDLGYYQFKEIMLDKEKVIVSRTGYTGEDGFEIYSSLTLGVRFFQELLEKGKPQGLVPVGLGARDTLRLEAKYPLYGHELNESRTPIESGIGWIVKEKLEPFLGYEKVINQRKNGAEWGIAGIKLMEPGVPRENYSIFHGEEKIGTTTSGSYSPTLKQGIALGFIQKAKIQEGLEIEIEIRGDRKKGVLQLSPFVQGSAKKK